MKKEWWIGVGLLVVIGLVVFSVTSEKASRPSTPTMREGVLNEVAIGDSVEKVIERFGNLYDQEDRTVSFTDEGTEVTYLAYIYPDAIIYTDDRLVKAIELTTPTYLSPRGIKIGDTREYLERVYWRPEGCTGTEEKYVMLVVKIAFYFENDLVSRIVTYDY